MTTDARTYTGSCHCQKVRYELTGTVSSAIACNCSMCRRKGTLLAFFPESSFTLVSGEDALTDYQFNKHVIHHLFCSTCGVTSFARGKLPDGSPMVAVNLRCLDEVDLDQVKVTSFDGKSK